MDGHSNNKILNYLFRLPNALVKEYTKERESLKILEMCETGLRCIKDSECVEEYRTFYYHFEVYKALHSDSNFITC